MKRLNLLDRYLLDNEYKIVIKSGCIDIYNYECINDFSSNKIVIKYRDGITTISGSNLVISKMLDDELIIVGNFDSIMYK